jgi:hypothetical protein
MDPITAIMGITALTGLGTSLFGSSSAVSANKTLAAESSQYYGLSQQIAGVQQQENYQQYLSMIYGSQRQEMENLRKTQQQIARITSANANQGGAGRQSSAEAAGTGAAAAGGAFNTGGLLQSIQSGQAFYGLTSQQTMLQGQQSGIQSQMATAQGQVASAQGLQQLGSGIMQAAQPFGRIGGSLYAQMTTPNFFNSGLGIPGTNA